MYIKITDFGRKDHMSNIRTATLNVSSVKNKYQMMLQELNNNNIDVALITEIWIKDTQEDLAWLKQSELCQGSYEISTHNRWVKGGVVVLH